MAEFDIGKLDEVIHGRVRLGIVAYLASAEVADFTELKEALQTTQGNLSVHLRKLEEAGYVEIEKSFLGRKPLEPDPSVRGAEVDGSLHIGDRPECH